jgi:hypothetical protein
MSPEEQAFALGRAWESLSEPKRQFVLQVVHPEGNLDTFRIGPHTPTMKDEDVLLLHRLWLNITREPGLENVHHHEILTEALTRFARDYGAREREEILKELKRLGSSAPAYGDPKNPTPPQLVRKEGDEDVSFPHRDS